MGIQAVSFGNNLQTSTIQAKPAKDKKPMGPIAKGATSGGGIGTGFAALGAVGLKFVANACDKSVGEFVKEAGGWGKYAFSVARGIAIYTAVGAAIGGIVKLVKGKEEDEPATEATPDLATPNNQTQEGQNVNANA